MSEPFDCDICGDTVTSVTVTLAVRGQFYRERELCKNCSASLFGSGREYANGSYSYINDFARWLVRLTGNDITELPKETD